MNRRGFLGIAVSSALQIGQARTFQRRGWHLELDSQDNIRSCRNGELELVHPQLLHNRPSVTGPAKLDYTVDLVDLGAGAVAIKQTITVHAETGKRERVTVEVPRCVRLPGENRTAFLPLFNGLARREPAGGLEAAYWITLRDGMEATQRLAIPVVSESSPQSSTRVTYCTDPMFSARFSDSIRWVYSDAVPLPERDQRSVFTILHDGGDDRALHLFYEAAVPGVHTGPDWLHNIAVVDYDYLSKNGDGWFRDIDTLERVIPRADRSKVFLVLHGWYGWIGRYTYHHATHSLEKRWVAFPNAQAPRVQELALKYNPKNPYSWKPESIRARRPVEMSIADMHRRLRYAKDRGFRVGLYFGDGLAAGQDLKDIYDPAKVLRWEGWVLPDTCGKSYVQNPLHPEVPAFFKGYMQALLLEYGRSIDGFVWDETFYLHSDDTGTPQYSGYAARAMMQLVHDVSVMVQSHSPELAFLTSDNLGLKKYDVPYAVVAHGNYQDSAMFPKAWDYGLFPNHRNVMWSCNWGPLGLFDRTRYAAETFDVPVSLSNGYGEDTGVSDMTADQLNQVIDLIAERKQRRMDMTWIEDNNGILTYKGRPVNPRPK
jgi:hypothetical protein